MKTVIQRVNKTSLSVGGNLISAIPFGLAVYLGIEKGDTEKNGELTAKKIAALRIFEDENGKMNRSVLDKGGEILLISQFTLCADTSGGNRPNFACAEEPDKAKALYLYVADKLREKGVVVKEGVFGADMSINQSNDGPVTIILNI